MIIGHHKTIIRIFFLHMSSFCYRACKQISRYPLDLAMIVKKCAPLQPQYKQIAYFSPSIKSISFMKSSIACNWLSMQQIYSMTLNQHVILTYLMVGILDFQTETQMGIDEGLPYMAVDTRRDTEKFIICQTH